MKNQRGYTHWVIMILISVMAVGLVSVAWYYEENKEESSVTTITNTNQDAININTNTATNINSIIITNTITNAETETNFTLDETNDGNHLTVYGHKFEYPNSWAVQQEDTSDIRYKDEIASFTYNEKSMGSLQCPYPEVGYELWLFEDTTRSYEYNGEPYGAELRIGTPNPETAGTEDVGNRYIIYMYQGNEFKDYQSTVCQITLSDTNGSLQNTAEEIFNSIAQD